MDFSPQTSVRGRVTLTAAQIKQPEINELLELLINLSVDGVITYEDVQKLVAWLNEHTRSEVPAVKYLFELMLNVCADGHITDDEYLDIHLAIERVLPKDYRDYITGKRKELYYTQAASAAQIELIGRLTGQPVPYMNRGEASDWITKYFDNPPGASNRQMMFLRFWNRTDLFEASRRQIADWMDDFLSEDPRRGAAWSLYKKDIADDGSQRDPSFVPLGIGNDYFARVSYFT